MVTVGKPDPKATALSPLFRLPPEIRRKIYKLLLLSRDDSTISYNLTLTDENLKRHYHIHRNILHVGRLIYMESAPVLWGSNCFSFFDFSSYLASGDAGYLPEHLKCVRKTEIYIELDWPNDEDTKSFCTWCSEVLAARFSRLETLKLNFDWLLLPLRGAGDTWKEDFLEKNALLKEIMESFKVNVRGLKRLEIDFWPDVDRRVKNEMIQGMEAVMALLKEGPKSIEESKIAISSTTCR